MSKGHRASFTLIELLITIGIVTILSVVVVLTLNPAQLLRQARDATRLSDIDNLNKALALHQVDVTGGTYGNASTTYVSIPDSSATCVNLGLPSLPTGYDYACATAANYKKVDGSGWIPVNLTQISSGSPLGVLPTDPVNTTNTGNYYTYITGSSWALSSLLESDKFLKQSAANDGGYDPGRYEQGSDLSLVAKNQGLIGWWAFDEGSGTTARDSSGNGNAGTLANGPTWLSAASCKAGPCLSFDAIDDEVSANNTTLLKPSNNWTVATWIKSRTTQGSDKIIVGKQGWHGGLIHLGDTIQFCILNNVGSGTCGPHTPTQGIWKYYVGTYNSANGQMYFYVNGVLESANTFSGTMNSYSDTIYIGGSGTPQYHSPVDVDDARSYSRALSAVEILAAYNATK